MKNWWFKIGCFLTGWNSKILESCTESSRKQLKKYTSAILILIILWSFIGYSFAERYVHAPWWGCLLTTLIFVVIVIQIERQIILTVGKNNWLASFRLIIAFIMAIIGSAILDQIIFKEDIEKKMIEIVDRQVNEQLPNRLTIINTKLQELQSEIDSLDRKNLELYAEISSRPTIETVSTVRSPMSVRKSNGADSIVFKTTISKNPISNPKMKEAEINNQHLEILRKQQEDYTHNKIDAEASLRDELKSKQGFLEELNAMIEILMERPVALIFYIVLFAFLMSLELFVVVSKLGDQRSDYDLVIEYQLEQKKRTLNELVR
ncbi:MAG TPA: DUF4407 domain-containing protein [Bacteroidales bacterium]|nr:DUF4407 domain-containing protein [Bacteroidales bacterium]